jgi:hypothetical protein
MVSVCSAPPPLRCCALKEQCEAVAKRRAARHQALDAGHDPSRPFRPTQHCIPPAPLPMHVAAGRNEWGSRPRVSTVRNMPRKRARGDSILLGLTGPGAAHHTFGGSTAVAVEPEPSRQLGETGQAGSCRQARPTRPRPPPGGRSSSGPASGRRQANAPNQRHGPSHSPRPARRRAGALPAGGLRARRAAHGKKT